MLNRFSPVDEILHSLTTHRVYVVVVVFDIIFRLYIMFFFVSVHVDLSFVTLSPITASLSFSLISVFGHVVVGLRLMLFFFK